jgi:hypothetical protein
MAAGVANPGVGSKRLQAYAWIRRGGTLEPSPRRGKPSSAALDTAKSELSRVYRSIPLADPH